MVFENYYQVISALRDYRKCRMCIGAAADETVLLDEGNGKQRGFSAYSP